MRCSACSAPVSPRRAHRCASCGGPLPRRTCSAGTPSLFRAVASAAGSIGALRGAHYPASPALPPLVRGIAISGPRPSCALRGALCALARVRGGRAGVVVSGVLSGRGKNYKKERPSELDYYRPISRLTAVYEVHAVIPKRRLTQAIDDFLQHTQYGCRPAEARLSRSFACGGC